MSKGLEALKWLMDNGYIKYENGWQAAPYILENINAIEKELKALEIIKDKFVNVTIFMGCDSLEEYNKHPLTMRKGRLTQEEYELLKEVLL